MCVAVTTVRFFVSVDDVYSKKTAATLHMTCNVFNTLFSTKK